MDVNIQQDIFSGETILSNMFHDGVFKNILKYLSIEDFLILSSTSKTIYNSIIEFKKGYNIFFNEWYNSCKKEIENVLEIFSRKPMLSIRSFNICPNPYSKRYLDSNKPQNHVMFKDIYQEMVDKLEGSSFSLSLSRGFFTRDKDGPLEFGFVRRYYFSHPDGSLFIVSTCEPFEDIWYSSLHMDWEDKIDYFNEDGKLVLSFGQYSSHNFIYGEFFEYANTNGDDDSIFQYEVIDINLVKEKIKEFLE